MIPSGSDPTLSQVTQSQTIATPNKTAEWVKTTAAGRLYAPPRAIVQKNDDYYKSRSLREVKRQVGGEEKFKQLPETEKKSLLEKKETALRKADQVIKLESSQTSDVSEKSSIIGKRVPKEEKSSQVINNAAQTPLKQIKEDFKTPDKLPTADTPPRTLSSPLKTRPLPTPPSPSSATLPRSTKPLPPVPTHPSETAPPRPLSPAPNRPSEAPPRPTSPSPTSVPPRTFPKLPDTPYIPPVPDYAPPELPENRIRPAPDSPAPQLSFNKVLTETIETEKTFIKHLEKLTEWGQTMAASDEKKVSEFGRELLDSVKPMLDSAKKFQSDLQDAANKPGIRSQIDGTAKAYAGTAKPYAENQKSYFECLKDLSIKQGSFDAKFQSLKTKYPEQMASVGDYQSSTITPIQRGPRHQLLLSEMNRSTGGLSLEEEIKSLNNALKGVKEGTTAINLEQRRMDEIGGYDKYVEYVEKYGADVVNKQLENPRQIEIAGGYEKYLKLCKKHGAEKVDKELAATNQFINGLDLKISTFNNMITLADCLNKGREDPKFTPAAQKYLKENLINEYPIEEMQERLSKMQDMKEALQKDPLNLKNSRDALFEQRDLLSLGNMHERFVNTLEGIFTVMADERRPPEGTVLTKEQEMKMKKTEIEIKDAQKIIEASIEHESKQDPATGKWKEKPDSNQFREALQRVSMYPTPQEPQAEPAQRAATTRVPHRILSGLRTGSKMPSRTPSQMTQVKSPSAMRTFTSRKPDATKVKEKDLHFAENISKKIDEAISYNENLLETTSNKMKNEDNSNQEVTNLLGKVKTCLGNIEKLNALKKKVNDTPSKVRKDLAKEDEVVEKALPFVQKAIDEIPPKVSNAINKLKDLTNKTQASEEEKRTYFHELDSLSADLANTIEDTKKELKSPGFTVLYQMYKLEGENLVRQPISEVSIGKPLMLQVSGYMTNEIPKAVENFEKNFMHGVVLKDIYGKNPGLPAFPKLGAGFKEEQEREILDYFKSRTPDEKLANDLQQAYIQLHKTYGKVAADTENYTTAAENFMNLFAQLPPASH